jgi:hypothetical protein
MQAGQPTAMGGCAEIRHALKGDVEATAGIEPAYTVLQTVA